MPMSAQTAMPPTTSQALRGMRMMSPLTHLAGRRPPDGLRDLGGIAKP